MAHVGDVATNMEMSGHGRTGVVPGRLEAALARAETTEAMYHSLVDRLPAITYTEALFQVEAEGLIADFPRLRMTRSSTARNP